MQSFQRRTFLLFFPSHTSTGIIPITNVFLHASLSLEGLIEEKVLEAVK